jgi:hypothetical protein
MTRHRFGFPSVFCGQTTCFVTHFEKESGDESPHYKNQQTAAGSVKRTLPLGQWGVG